MPVRVTIYTKPGCHLCEIVEQAVADSRSRIEFDLTTVDVTQDQASMEKHGFDIPVVTINDAVYSSYYIDGAAFENEIRKENDKHANKS